MNLNFAENLKSLRKKKGVTQEKLADVLGVSAQSISRWELCICYPDIEMLPSIANYFGVTVDYLLSNDIRSKERDFEIFNETLDKLSNTTTETIDFISGYCQKYPEDDRYAFQLVCAIKRYAGADAKKAEKYMPVLLKKAQRLLETQYRNSTVQIMATLCDEADLNHWLDLTPYNSGFSRRYCLVTRAQTKNDWNEAYIQQGMRMFESLAVQLDGLCPDRFGAKNKAAFQQSILDVLQSFGENGEVPDGWKCFYAYKQLVLAACLFAQQEDAAGWKNFDAAIEKCKYVHSLKDEWLNVGGALFSNIKVNKNWSYAIDEAGKTRELFGIVNFACHSMLLIRDVLTNPQWAWFNSVRETPRFKAALAWVEEAYNAQNTAE